MSDVLSRIDYHLDSVMTQVPAILCSSSKKTDTTLRERKQRKKNNLSSHTHTKMENLYAALGVGSSANEKEVKRAYLRLCKEHHPDKSEADDAQERFQDISEAYQTLSDPHKKRTYDARRFRKRLRPVDMTTTTQRIAEEVVPIKIRVTVGLKEAYASTKEIQLAFKRKIECDRCSALGSNKLEVCATCEGDKWVFDLDADGGGGGGGDSDPMEFKSVMSCPSCGGKGSLPHGTRGGGGGNNNITTTTTTTTTATKRQKVERGKEVLDCADCEGRGYTMETKLVSFFLFVENRAVRVRRFQGQGDVRLGREPGDVYVMVCIEPQRGNYRLCKNGTTLVYTKTISLSDALEGRAGSLTTLDDREIAIPRSTREQRGPIRHGEEVWIQGEGMCGASSSALCVVFHLELPVLSPQRIQQIREWEGDSENQWKLLYGRPG